MSFTIVSWNILAQVYLRPEEFLFEAKNEFLLEWPYRLRALLSVLQNINADVILLQEVTLASFEEDFLPVLSSYAYVRHIQNKQRSNSIGNVIMWKKDKAKPIQSCSKTRSLHVKLSMGALTLAISNVHLSAGLKSKQGERMKEITSCLAVWQEEPVVILGGDYNDDFSSPEGIITLLSHFTPPHTKATCIARNTPHNFDHILIRGKLTAAYFPPPVNILTTSIPNAVIPSDHLPIMYKLTPDS